MKGAKEIHTSYSEKMSENLSDQRDLGGNTRSLWLVEKISLKIHQIPNFTIITVMPRI